MYPFLPKGTVLETPSRETPSRETARPRRSPLRALMTRTGDLALRATWSPTR